MANNETLTTIVGVNTPENRTQILRGRLLKLKDNLYFDSTEITIAFCEKLGDDETVANQLMRGTLDTIKVTADSQTPGVDTLWLKHHAGCLVEVKGTASQTKSGQYWMNVDVVRIVDEDASEEEKAIRRPALPARVERPERRTGHVYQF